MTTALILWGIALALLCVVLSSRGHDTSAPAPMNLGNFVLGPEPVVVIRIPDTGRTKFGEESSLRLRCTITSDGYFEKNKGVGGIEGHFGFMARANLAAIDTGNYRGHGVICGSLWTASEPPNGMKSMTSCAAIESWANGAPDRTLQWVKPETVSQQLQDGVPIALDMLSTKIDGKWFLSYSLNDGPPFTIEDDNTHIDPASQALALFAINPGGGVLHVEHLTAEWS